MWWLRGRKPLGDKLLDNEAASRTAIKTAFWDYWETAVLSQILAGKPFGITFWQFGDFQAGK